MDIVDQAMGIFHEEILMEILIRLPVSSLLRFECVSKPWKELISNPYFKVKHLNHAKNVNNFQKLFVAQMCIHSYDTCTFYSSSLSSSVQLVGDERKLDFPCDWKPWGCLTLSCCDGLVLLALNELLCDDRINDHLLLWNPSTRESIELPCPKSPLKHCVFGMGYDTASDDYKILAIDLNDRSLTVTCEIIALKSGSWRICKYLSRFYRLMGYVDSGMDCLAFLHGAFHWVGWPEYYTIFSLDISNEVCGEIPLSDQMFYKPTRYIEHGVSILEGMLCFYSTYESGAEGLSSLVGGTFMLWVMKDYGIKESWTLLFRIQDTNLFSSARPKYRYADGEVLLRCRHVSHFGFVYRTAKGPFGLWPEDDIIGRGAVYTESLISPKLLT